jgi:hypothetical protein
MVVKDEHNRSVSGFKAVIDDEIFNLAYLSFAKEINLYSHKLRIFPKVWTS